jgi:hypothetical protein
MNIWKSAVEAENDITIVSAGADTACTKLESGENNRIYKVSGMNNGCLNILSKKLHTV